MGDGDDGVRGGKEDHRRPRDALLSSAGWVGSCTWERTATRRERNRGGEEAAGEGAAPGAQCSLKL